MARKIPRRALFAPFLALAFFLLCGAAVPRGKDSEPAVTKVVRRLEARYRDAKSFRAAFLQRRSEGSRSMQVESGTLYLQKPGRMRWDYESPEKKLFLVDGRFAWFYVPADRTVTKAPVREADEEQIPLLLLAGKVKLGRVCRRIEFADVHVQAVGNVALRCLPVRAAAEEYREAVFEVDAGDHLVRLVVREPGDVETEYQFGKWEENLALPADLFHFFPPEGTAVVDERSLSRRPDQ